MNWAYSGISGQAAQQASSQAACIILPVQDITMEAMPILGTTVPYHNFYGDLSILFCLVNGIIIGYMAGALNNGSSKLSNEC